MEASSRPVPIRYSVFAPETNSGDVEPFARAGGGGGGDGGVGVPGQRPGHGHPDRISGPAGPAQFADGAEPAFGGAGVGGEDLLGRLVAGAVGPLVDVVHGAAVEGGGVQQAGEHGGGFADPERHVVQAP